MAEPVKLVFAEGCFDGLDLTQDQIDELVAKIREAHARGEFEDGFKMTEEEFLSMVESDSPQRVQTRH